MMKRTLLSFILVVLSCLTSIAQSPITQGFYRVQNQASGRYLYVRDCTGDISSLGADMGAIELWLGKENTISDPSCVMFFKSQGGAWDIQSQATGVYQMTGQYMTITTYNGAYVVYNSGQYLYDITRDNTTPRGRIGAKTDNEMKGYSSYKKWDVLPINSSTDQYFGFKPTISAGGSYYTTFYADFAFTPKSDNTKVWYVSKVDKQYGIAVIKQITGTVSRSQAVIIQSNSSQPTNNRVDLTTATGNSASENKLTGVFFSNGDRSYVQHTGNPAYVEFNAQTMRLLGKDADGKLAFVNNPTDLIQTDIDPGTGTWRPAMVVPHNQAFLKVDADCPATLQVMTEQEYDAFILANTKYTLTYKVDGQVYKQCSLKAGDVITPEAAPVKTGHTFSGWQNLPTVMPAHDVEVTGVFTVNSYTLTYMVDGAVYKTYSVNYGASITAEAAPTKTGYTFSGWQNLPSTMPANDVTVTGSFMVNKHKLIYKVDGQLYKSFDVDYGTRITPEAAPSKEGYTFSGWSDIPTTMPDNDVTVTGSFKVNCYTLTYKVDGEVYRTYNVNFGSIITPETAPTKEGYTFSGWSEIPSTMPAHDVTITGKFTVNSYTLTYKIDDEVFKSYNVNYGATITPETAPTRTGHTFSGWYNLPSVMPAHDVVVTGSFTVNKYKLIYKVDGQIYKTFDVAYGAAVTPEATPTKEGHTFSGWSDIPTTMPDRDVTVTGSFKINSYTLTYMVDGEIYRTYTIDFATSITPEVAPTKEGYTFSGWSQIPAIMPARDITVTGSFKINHYTLTYMVDGAVYKTCTLDYGATIIPEQAPIKEGYTFSGWSEVPTTMPAKDVTVTASFSVNSYNLTYVVDDAVYKTVTVSYGVAISPETAPTKEGYTFSGWSEIPATMPARDVTITGSFKLNNYKLTYKVDDVVYKTYTIYYGTIVIPEQNPTKEGYTFSGWSDIPETMPACDVVITGSYMVNSYNLTYIVDGEVYKTCILDYGTSITPEPALEREGEKFSGWSEIPATMPAHDVEVYGSFNTNHYILIYKVNGVVYRTFSFEYGSPITPIDEPTQRGYTFSGWSDIPATMPAHNVEVNGSFSINSYTLTYMVDGTEYASYEVEYGSVVEPEPAPVLEGYTFSGWNGLPSSMPAEDVTVTGSFIVNSYKLTYYVDDVVFNTVTVNYGTNIIPIDSPTRDGYTFSGWSDIPEVMPSCDVNVYGTFSVNSYTLTYLVDGEEYEQFEYSYGSYIEPVQEPVCEGYTFSGWTGLPTKMPARDVIVIGSFSVNSYKLEYFVDDKLYSSLTIEYDSPIEPIDDPVREGYVFSGWSEIPETMPAHDVKVTGSFKLDTFTLTYLLDGEVYKTVKYLYNDKIEPESNPVREGYTFSGWSGLPSYMPAEDVTVTGSLSINSYRLNYIIDGNVYTTVIVQYGSIIDPVEPPVRDGYVFSGWENLPEVMPARNLDVTGSYSPQKYKLTYIVDDEVYKTVEYIFNTRIVPEESPEREGHTFNGWSGLPSFMPAEDVVVVGTFTINKYRITYLYNSNPVKFVTLEYGAEIPEFIYQPEADRNHTYTFVEWLENGEPFTLTTMPARNIVLTANVQATGIDAVRESVSYVIYDLQGRRVENMQRGKMYIVNGKKYLYK